ncbi:hypothetical protein [Aquihabitans sp. McL0605]|uniref:hypothetical protein n=1 Tax=Aquihabitans sp. McL0605 TaxID=3415671 RepID=UPI003CF497DA
MSATACDRFRDVAPELALGIAVGDERAAALDHLDACAECRRELDRLTSTVDAVIASAPAAEPSSGFELRALAGFDEAASGVVALPATPRRSRRLRWVAAAAAAVVLALAAGGIVQWRNQQGPSRPGSTEIAAGAGAHGVLTTPDGAAVGSVHVDHGSVGTAGAASQLVVAVDAGAPTGTYRVQCDYESGRPYTAGELEVGAGGVPHWSATVSVPTYDLRRVRLVSTTGSENLEAELAR